MSNHDTWVKLLPENPLVDSLHLFEDGMIPMRDPFGMTTGIDAQGKTVSLWIIDFNRLDDRHFDAIADAIARRHGVSADEVKREAVEQGGFAINGEWIASMYCGPEGMQRTKELADFLATVPEPPDPAAWEAFIADQHRRWIEGDEITPPLPQSIEEFDARLVTPELEQALKQQQVKQLLDQGDYSVLDMLTGRAMADVLNQVEPGNTYSVVGWDEAED